MEQEQKAKEYREFDPSVLKASNGGGGDFADYVMLPAEEPFKAHIDSLKIADKFSKQTGKEEERLYVWCELDEGDGKGQKYRADFNPVITPKGSSKKSNLADFLEKVYGEHQSTIDAKDIIGRPIRIELSEPWGEKNLQFIKTFKKPSADQKRVEPDVVLEDLPVNAPSDELLDEIFPR